MEINKEFIKLLVIGLVMHFIVGLFLKNIISAVKFSLVYSIIFYIPLLTWTIKIKKTSIFSKFILTNVFGLCLIPIIYAIIGYFRPLNPILFILPSLVIFLIGISYNNIFKSNNISKKDGTIHNNTSI